MSLSAHFGVLRTIELRRLLEDEDQINRMIRYSQKFQRLKRATENMLVSNHRLARASLSQKPAFRDAKVLLAVKYKELEKLSSSIQTKQEQLAEKYTVHNAQWFLLRKMSHAEEESEMLFEKFAEGKTPVAEFLECFQSWRKLYHIRLVLVKRIQEMITPGQKEIHPDAAEHFSVGFPGEGPDTCYPFCSLTTTILWPAAFCHSVPFHPPFLLPIGAHANSVQPLQHLPSCFGNGEPVCPRLCGQGPTWPARPVRLQPLKMQQRKHHQAPR